MTDKKTILIALHDMGVASAIIDALPQLAKKYKLHIFAKENMAYTALERRFSDAELARFNVLGYNIMTVVSARLILRFIRPDYVITGISNIYREYEGQGDIIHKGDFSFCEAANKMKIPTIGVLEAVSMSNKLLKARFNESRSLPRELIVQNTDIKKKIMQFGFLKEKNITVATMPKYARFSQIATENKDKIRNDLLKRNHIDRTQFVVFYSTSASPTEDFPALEYLAEELRDRKDISIMFGFHPKDAQSPEFLKKLNKILPSGVIMDFGSSDAIIAVSALTSEDKGLYCGVKTSMLTDVALTKANLAFINLEHNKEYSKNLSSLGYEILGDKKGELSCLVDEIKKHGRLSKQISMEQFDSPNAVEEFCTKIDNIVESKFN